CSSILPCASLLFFPPSHFFHSGFLPIPYNQLTIFFNPFKNPPTGLSSFLLLSTLNTPLLRILSRVI
ncbi:unnamed protein product, partial [Citrullus colocynthis]